MKSSIALFAALAVALPSVLADSIGFNFVSNRNASAAMSAGETAGAPGVVQGNWNNSTTATSGSRSNLNDDTGTTTTTDLSWSANGSWTTNNGTGNGHSKLYNGYLDNVGGSGFCTVDLSQIPYAQYDVYVYFGSDGNGRTGGAEDITAGGSGIEYTYSTSANFGGFGAGNYIQTTNATGGTPSANYCVFTANTSPTFNVRINRGSNNSGIFGVQIVETTPVPGLPEVETLAATAITPTTATANGDLIDNGDGTDSAALTIYWGAVDGAANAASWAASTSAGSRTSPGTFSAPLSGLSPNTTYHYRAFANNSAGDDWAPASQSFTTPAATPTVSNIAATEVFGSSATIGGEVTSTGGETPTLTLYYGDDDAGTAAGSWDNSIDLGTQSGSATTGLSGLTPNTTYFFRAAATNSGGTAWASATANFTTPVVTLPSVINIAASGVNGTFATLNGRVTDAGGDRPLISILFGGNDAGTNKPQWDGTIGLGTQTGNFSALVSNLTPETTYYFRALATNAAGEVWASPSLSFTTPVFTPPSVVINEIFYDPNDKTSPAEFIELHNPTGDDVDISGYFFDKGIDFTFPSNSTLSAGGYVVIAQDPSLYPGSYGPFLNGTSLKNSGETLELRDPGDNTVDEVDYGLGFPWPTTGDLVGAPLASPSIELINPLLDNDLAGSWRASGFPVATTGGGGSPQNFVTSGDTWAFLDDGSDQGTAWRASAFNDSGWATNVTELGYGDGDEAFVINSGPAGGRFATTYFRKDVTIPNPAAFNAFELDITYDDAYAIYVNGAEVARHSGLSANAPYDEYSTNTVGDNDIDNLVIPTSAFVAGNNVIAVEIHQSSPGSSDVSFDLELTGAFGVSTANRAPSPGAQNRSFSNNAPPQLRQVDHEPVGRVPDQDKSILPGEDVLISVKATDPDGVGNVLLEYQLVDPGSYLKKDDPLYATSWTTIPMTDDGTGGDLTAADATYSATIPGALNTHRRLVRYRIVAQDTPGSSIRAPYTDDEGLNFAYFVYGGVPTWQGFDFAAMEQVAPYHLITTREEHIDAQYIPPSTRGSGYTGSDYLWTGALVYNGKVYDHIDFRARGGVWRYAMGKNMWKFDFHRGRRFQARDDYGEKYGQEWDKLNFSSLIQQGNFGQRGEQGLFERAGFRLHNLTGNQAPNSHYVHFRIIEDADETGPTASQFDDDFQGLYLAIEQLDGQFLDEHNLPDGNLYKMEGGSGELNNQGATMPSDKSDLNAYLGEFDGGNTATQQWWEDNVWLDDYYNFYACITAIHDNDIHANKNYFFFHRPDDPLDPHSGKWQTINWDLDLCWTTTYRLNNAPDDRLDQDVFAFPDFQRDYRNRMREIRDLLWNAEQAGLLLDETAQFVHTAGQPSFVDADKAMWDTNPILTSGYINNSKAGHNKYWEATSGPRSFAKMIDHVKNYVNTRASYIDNTVLTDDAQVPATPTITYTGASGFPVNDLQFTSSAYSSPSGSAFAAMEWRLAEITPPAMLNKLEPPKYEIEADWESAEITTFTTAQDYPTLAARPGNTYRARVRHKDAAGRWGHWSAPVEFVASVPDLAPYIDALRVTEVHYHPTDETPAEAAMGWTASSFEFVEIQNIGTTAVDLTDVRFTKGIDFDFIAGTTIAPGAYGLIVANQAAFESRYGAGLPIAGTWAADNRLSNGGENLKLSLGAGISIIEFEYDDNSPWPTEPDGDGFSLVLDCPEDSLPADHADPLAWRASRLLGGSPGAADGVHFDDWKTANGLTAGATLTEDLDGDGLSNMLEYALASDPTANSLDALPTAANQLLTVGQTTAEYLTLTFTRQVGAKDLTYTVEFSGDLESWSATGGELQATIPNDDGTAVEVWRAPAPSADNERYFLRLRVDG